MNDDMPTPVKAREVLERLVSGTELAKMLGVHKSTITAWANKGIIRRLPMGQRTFYDPEEVMEAIKYRAVETPSVGGSEP